MPEFNFKLVFEWLASIIVMLGGTGAIILGLSKWFGDRFANKLLESDKAMYQRELEKIKTNYLTELEGVKSKYQAELETKKTELEKSKALFFRYSENQFSLYNELWKNLCDLKHVGESLWERVEPEKLKSFSEQLNSTKLAIEKSALLIEDKHYKELIEILEEFGNFETGKRNLIELRKLDNEIVQMEVNLGKANEVINKNKSVKERYTNLLNKLSKSFKNQLRGE
ncbi:MAG: hypothetical protein AAB336_06230 [Acidobacteriota bacterium]